jgi:hypothetical protein
MVEGRVGPHLGKSDCVSDVRPLANIRRFVLRTDTAREVCVLLRSTPGLIVLESTEAKVYLSSSSLFEQGYTGKGGSRSHGVYGVRSIVG